jgi:DNA-binding GntR family transcriptional regulator
MHSADNRKEKKQLTVRMGERFVFDRTRLSAPQIADTLRERILSLELEPGTTLSRAELQKWFGVSQIPLRDALLKLEEEGLVMTYPQYATRVSRINLDRARQAHFMRRAVETDIVRLLASSSSPAVIGELRHANKRLKIEIEAQDHAAFLIADREFHRIMYQHAELLDVWATLRANSGHLDRLRRLNLPSVGLDRIASQHDRLVDTIENGDPEQAAGVLREHLANTFTMLDTIGEEFPGFIEVSV